MTGLGSPKASYVIQELIGATATGIQGTATTVTIVAATVKTAGRRITIAGDPPAPIAAAAVAKMGDANSSSALSFSPGLISTIGSITEVPGTAPQGVSRRAALGRAAIGSTSNLIVRTIPDADFQTAQKTSGSAWHDFLDDFSNLAVSNVDQGFTNTTGLSSAAKVVSSVAGTSTGIVENLLISNASALAQVANTVALRLHDENVMIWQETAALVAAGILAGTHLMRSRQSGQIPPRKRRNQKYLCVGE